MAAITWLKVRGQEFSPDEAREASDFGEVLLNFSQSPEESFNLVGYNKLSVGRRLFFAEKSTIDQISEMLLFESDKRIVGVIQARLKEAREAKYVV